MALSFLMPKLYSNTILSSLNARTSMRRDLANLSGDGPARSTRVSATYTSTPTKIHLTDRGSRDPTSSISLAMEPTAQMQSPDPR